MVKGYSQVDEKTMEYHNNMSATREKFQQWAQTPEGKKRIKEWLQKQGYTLDDNWNLVETYDGSEKEEEL